MIARAEVETGSVQFGTRELRFTLQRTARRKTVSIAVDPRAGLQVKAPAGVPRERVERIVHQRAGWIVSRLRKMADLAPAPNAREFVSGETFLYLGRQHRLRVVEVASDEEGVKLDRGRLVVTVRAGAGPKRVRALLVRWMRGQAERRLPEVVRRWAARMGVPAPKVIVRDQKLRWGSCDAGGVVRLNWRVVQAAPRLVEYVAAHELVHLEHAEHSAIFWRRVGGVMPEYEGRREGLRRVGRMLVW